MIETRHICDRCGSCIVESRALLRIETGLVRARGVEQVDLCKECDSEFNDFLRGAGRLASVLAATP